MATQHAKRKPAAKKAPARKRTAKATEPKQGGAEAARGLHQSEAAGSIPAPAPTPTAPPAPEESAQSAMDWADWRALPDAMEQFVEYLLDGSGNNHLAGFCRARGFKYTTVLAWLDADPARTEMYARAREARADIQAEAIVGISDELVIDSAAAQRNKLRVDARKWLAAKMKPRTYGERLELAHENLKDISDANLVRKLADLGIQATIGPRPPAEADGDG